MRGSQTTLRTLLSLKTYTVSRETGRLEKPLKKFELMKVMRAKRIPLPQNATLELREVDKQFNEANMTAITLSKGQ